MKKLILIITILIPQLTISQGYADYTKDFFIQAIGNVNLYNLKSYDNTVKGSPYLENDYKSGKIIFENGKQYEAQIRLNVSEQKFEIRKNNTSQASAIDIDQSVTVEINGKKYGLHSFSFNSESNNTIGVLENVIELEKYSLYYFPRKKIEMPNQPNVIAPTTGYTKPPSPEWVDSSVFLIFHNNQTYTVPTSHKKMKDLNLLDEKTYKKYRKANKLNLKNKGSLKNFVKYLNSTNP